MASIIIEGFDEIGPNSKDTVNLLYQLGWHQGNTYSSAGVTDSLATNTGYALSIGAVSAFPGNLIVKTLPHGYSRLIGGFRFSTQLLSDVGIEFFDDFNFQAFICIQHFTGYVQLYDTKSALVAQGTRIIGENQTHYLEFDIYFGNPGYCTVWLDGVMLFASAGNFQAATNATASVVGFCSRSSASGGWIVDDFYLFDQTTAHNNSVLLSNPYVLTQFPTNDAQTQFTNLGNVLGYTATNSNTWSNCYGDRLWLYPITANVNCSMNAVVVVSTPAGSAGTTSKFKGVLYSDNVGKPGTLLGQSPEKIGMGAGFAENILQLTTPVALVAGTQYWIGFIVDSSGTHYFSRNIPDDNLGQVGSAPYASGPPTTAPVMTSGQDTLNIFAACSGAATNWESVGEIPPVEDFSAVSASAPGTEDLYRIPALPVSIVLVYGIEIIGNAYLTLPGTHTFDLICNSAGVESAGDNPNISATQTFAWYSTRYDTDPATGAQWTPSGVDLAEYGMKILT